MTARPLFIGGTSSNAGKSWMATAICAWLRTPVPLPDEFFEGTDLAADMRPRLHIVRYRTRAHVYQRRASCCRFYLVPEGQLCASCPLLSHEERVARNLAWMKKHIDEPSGRRGHS